MRGVVPEEHRLGPAVLPLPSGHLFICRQGTALGTRPVFLTYDWFPSRACMWESYGSAQEWSVKETLS